MTIQQGLEEEYQHFVEASSKDGCSLATIQYMGRWADLMEAEMASGVAIPDMAEETSHQADTESISGFQYGLAVNGLAYFWIHGEELRQWHNQRHSCEGQGTANPAVFTISM